MIRAARDYSRGYARLNSPLFLVSSPYFPQGCCDSHRFGCQLTDAPRGCWEHVFHSADSGISDRHTHNSLCFAVTGQVIRTGEIESDAAAGCLGLIPIHASELYSKISLKTMNTGRVFQATSDDV